MKREAKNITPEIHKKLQEIHPWLSEKERIDLYEYAQLFKQKVDEKRS